MKTVFNAALVTLLLFTCLLPLTGQELTNLVPVTATDPGAVIAADAVALATDGADSTAPKWLVDIIDKALDKQPWLIIVFTVMGLLRTIAKPVTLFLEARVKDSPSLDDDAKFAKVTGSKWFKWVMIGLDYVASVKPITKKP